MADLLSNLLSPIQSYLMPSAPPTPQPMQRGQSVSQQPGYTRPQAPPPQVNTKALGDLLSGLVNKGASTLAGPNFSNWTHDLGQDYKNRGVVEGTQSLFNPILMNDWVYPIAEPIVSGIRVAKYKVGNTLSGKTPEPVPHYRPSASPQGVLSRPAPTMNPSPLLSQPTPAPTMAPRAPMGALGRNPDLPKKPMAPAVQNAILSASKEFGVPHQLLFDIAYSEGGFRPDAANETAEGRAVGVPRGLFQFTPGTWENDLRTYASAPNTSLKNFLVNGQVPDRNDPVANARAAAYLIKMGQLARWDASLPNWGRFWNDEEIADYYKQSPGHSKRRK